MGPQTGGGHKDHIQLFQIRSDGKLMRGKDEKEQSCARAYSSMRVYNLSMPQDISRDLVSSAPDSIGKATLLVR